MSGYLREERPLDTKKVEMGLSATYDLSIPNREIAEVYRKEIFEQMTVAFCKKYVAVEKADQQ